MTKWLNSTNGHRPMGEGVPVTSSFARRWEETIFGNWYTWCQKKNTHTHTKKNTRILHLELCWMLWDSWETGGMKWSHLGNWCVWYQFNPHKKSPESKSAFGDGFWCSGILGVLISWCIWMRGSHFWWLVHLVLEGWMDRTQKVTRINHHFGLSEDVHRCLKMSWGWWVGAGNWYIWCRILRYHQNPSTGIGRCLKRSGSNRWNSTQCKWIWWFGDV